MEAGNFGISIPNLMNVQVNSDFGTAEFNIVLSAKYYKYLRKFQIFEKISNNYF